jgi:hypothetical protein
MPAHVSVLLRKKSGSRTPPGRACSVNESSTVNETLGRASGSACPSRVKASVFGKAGCGEHPLLSGVVGRRPRCSVEAIVRTAFRLLNVKESGHCRSLLSP